MNRHVRSAITDERGSISTARIGIWLTLIAIFATVYVDIVLTIIDASSRVPNTTYSILSAMFIAFAGWAGGPRVAQYLGKPSEVAKALANAVRDKREPNNRTDDERGKHTDREEVE